MKIHNKSLISTIILFVIVFTLLANPQPVQAACAPDHIIYVSLAGDNTTGCSWASAFITLQSALAIATSGDQIWVAEGTYYPDEGAGQTNNDRNSTFQLLNGVAIYGGFAGSETLLSQRDSIVNITILSGDIGILGDNSDNSYHVVTGSGTNGSSILDGFTITGGNANNGSIANANNGGGVFNNDGNPTLLNLIIINNISNNLGGGMYNTNSSPTLTKVIFNGNSAVRGAGMFNIVNSNATLTDVTFSNNTASLRGGGISAAGSSLSLTNVTFNGNTAQFGGGMQNIFGSNSALTNVTFNGNTASNSGGAMLIIDNNPTLTNVTISGNTAPVGGGIYNDNTVSSPVITNSIIYGNTGGQISNINVSLADVTYSVVEGGYAGTGNTSNDPILGPLQNNGGFTNTMALQTGSSAINAGDNSVCPSSDQRGVVRPQPSGGNCDIGAYELDNTAPTVTINQAIGQADPTNASPINFTAVFSEAVTGFTNADVTLGGTAGATTAVVTGGPTTFNVAVSGMTGSGTVIASIPANAATDIAGNNNTASTSTDNTVTYDATAPTVTINQAVGQADPTNTSPINFTVVFSEAVTGFTTGDVSFTGSTVGGTLVGTVSGGPTTYTVAVTGMTTPGDVVASIAANVAADLAGNNNAASTSTDNTITYDTTAPTVTINQAVGQADPTNASPINFTVVFSEAVTGFATGDVSFTGSTVGGTLVGTVSGGPTTYTVAVTGMTTPGDVLATIAASVATDTAGNNNTASTSTDNTVTYDASGPTVTINQAVGQADPTNASPINFTVVFSEAVTGFATGDVTLSGTAGATTGIVTEIAPNNGTTYNVAVSGMTGDGTATASVPASAAVDAFNNPNAASTSTDNTVTYDATAPTVTINQAVGQADPTNVSPINFTVVFSEAVTGFTNADISLSGIAGATTAVVSGGPITFNVAVSGMTGDGTVVASLAADIATDSAGNNNIASTSTDNTVTYNSSLPDTTIDSNPPNPSNVASATFTFSSPDADVVGFECRLDSGVFASCTSPQNYAGLSVGFHTFEVRAVDDVGNVDPFPASYTWLVDLGFPTVADTTPANGSSVDAPGPTQLIVRFSENVKNDGSAGAANNTVNYLLVEPGADTLFNTLSCVGGLIADDTQITVDSASYTNNGGSGPFVATLNINGGMPLPLGTYRLFACGTTSIEDLAGNELNNGTADTIITFTVITAPATQPGTSTTLAVPATGFPQDQITSLPVQSVDKAYASTNIWIEIPKLGVKMSVVGVPQTNNGWDVTWLNRDAGWLNGSAFPTWNGNSVITAHVWDALNNPGPFAKLKDLKYGDQAKIHAFGQVFIYEVRESLLISPTNTAAMLKHQEKSWLTLITCEDYQELSQKYSYRRMVRAVLVSVILDK